MVSRSDHAFQERPLKWQVTLFQFIKPPGNTLEATELSGFFSLASIISLVPYSLSFFLR